jgi:hypothetical protein
MKKLLCCFVIGVSLLDADFCIAGSGPTITASATHTPRQVEILITFSDAVNPNDTIAKNYKMFDGKGTSLVADRVVTGGTAMACFFEVTSASVAFLEGLVSTTAGSSTYYVDNLQPIRFTGGAAPISTDGLATTLIGFLPKAQWDDFIMDQYSCQYLFPHKIALSTDVSQQDSTKTTFALDFAQSDSYFQSSSWSGYWALSSRWSTISDDPLNFVKAYPLVIQLNSVNLTSAGLLGVETGPEGFGKLGKVTAHFNMSGRLHWAPIDLTFGHTRLRPYPVLSFDVAGFGSWADHKLTDPAMSGVQTTLGLHYDIPMGLNYLFQVDGQGMSTPEDKYRLRSLLYSYDISFGYVANGDIRIALSYKQGSNGVTYNFDRRLLIGVVSDALNSLNK